MRTSQPGKSYFVVHDFNRIWRFIPLNRPRKELLKRLLFKSFPFIFKRWAIYQNWHNAQVFANKSLSPASLAYWKRLLYRTYELKIIPPSGNSNTKDFSKLAVVIHAFYPEVLQQIIGMLGHSANCQIHLYVTAPAEVYQSIEAILSHSALPFKLTLVENHGRDILPFLHTLPKVMGDGYDIILKLHTKKSNHLNRKAFWRNDLFDKLIGDGALQRNMKIFSMNENVGMIGPAGHVLPMRYYYGANALAVSFLGHKMGLTTYQFQDLNFVAGSMFFARREVLWPLLRLGMGSGQFEAEDGQIDGTMAHAIERAFSLGLISSGMALADTSYNPEHPVLTITKSHYFSV